MDFAYLITRRILVYPLLLLLILNFTCFAHDNSEKLLGMSIEELMKVKIFSGSLTGTQRINSPVSHTEITREMIEHSPARDLLDLLEIYVPGFTYVNHYMGPRIGIRGVLGDQNYSYLLLVNGRDMNLRMVHGPLFELENKELHDIERIEIISGPGSVTYGPGAIGGVINIITKKPDEDNKGLQAFTEGNLEYRYAHASLQYSNQYKDFKILVNASVSRSQGLEKSKYYYVCWADDCGYGFMSPTWGSLGYGSDAPKMFDDFDDLPQYKFNLNAYYKNNLHFWMRYTTFSHTKLTQESHAADGNAFSGIKGKSFIASADHKIKLSEKVELDNSAGYDSKCYRDHALIFGSNFTFDDILQRSASFSENIISGKSLLNYQHSDKLDLALGAEIEYQWYGPEWGQDQNTFLYRFQNPLKYVVLDSSSAFHQYLIDSDNTTVINGTIDGYQYSFFGESNWRPTDKITVLLSGRADKHCHADWALSPRVAFMYSYNTNNHFRVTAQQSVRLPLFSDLYSENEISGGEAETEELKGFELAYTRMQSENLRINIAGFYNTIDQVAWLSTEEQAGLVGTFESIGYEITTEYKKNNTRLLGSYAFVDQLSWDPSAPTEAYLSNIGLDSIDVYMDGYATNRMNNTPRHAIKLSCDQKFKKTINLHFDGRVYWGYGQIDMMDMFLKVHKEYGIEATKNTMQAIYDEMLDYGYTRPSFTSNIYLSWKLPFTGVKAEAALYAMNIISHNHLRYVIQYWGAGNQRHYPRQCSFVEEPVTFGITFNIKI